MGWGDGEGVGVVALLGKALTKCLASSLLAIKAGV